MLSHSSSSSCQSATERRTPDFLYIGTSKAGSTWLYNVLASHPGISLAPGKGTYFFDQHYDLGPEWYSEQFAFAPKNHIAGEISHSYLSSPEAPQRIAAMIPDVKLLICLREPVQRAFSAYLDAVKNGRFEGTFEEAIERLPSLLHRGHYATQLQRYLQLFPRKQLHVSIFDDLGVQAQRFADEIFDFLEVPRQTLNSATRGKMMPAAVPRYRPLTQVVKRIARTADKVGLRELRGRVKRSRLVRNVLYRPLSIDEMPKMSEQVQQRCRDLFAPEVKELDEMLGLNLQQRWNYVSVRSRVE